MRDRQSATNNTQNGLTAIERWNARETYSMTAIVSDLKKYTYNT